ncbi:MAG: hypothetical protein ACI8RZ_005567, partial [Myxococcota bacterium]
VEVTHNRSQHRAEEQKQAKRLVDDSFEDMEVREVGEGREQRPRLLALSSSASSGSTTNTTSSPIDTGGDGEWAAPSRSAV